MSTNPTNEHREQAREIVKEWQDAEPVYDPFADWEKLEAAIAAALSSRTPVVEYRIAMRFLAKNGYARCTSVECGCNSWHVREDVITRG